MKGSWGTTDLNIVAKLHLIKVMQSQCFDEELTYLRSPDNKKVPDRVRDMNLYLDSNHILRSSGRMGRIDCLPSDVLNPIVLGKNHDLTKLIIEDCHKRVKHLGVQATLNIVRLSGFRVVSPYQTIKNVIHSCLICRKFIIYLIIPPI